ncbi:serine protease [Agrobacterium tumefaciens]|uniref:trypsin-like serine peptidase n=1 Tax=Agrobacterium tumefaciens TaxID=358 RepID=UPI00157273A0|nr:serine protease [Agrobacterium tumefaciens]NSZ66975.1 trypsin-like peptidase domain-containing protein [Agrobacterium tumefaciens]NTA73354.1 trypsin-like peptidase domain-containing protein [Agrobacterium tumefaciens]WIE41138.1 serine protease [Agrobacterium tumefaciens]
MDEEFDKTEPHAHGPLNNANSLLEIAGLMGRTCRLSCGTATGSAFLVAPDLIMTAFHVVEELWSEMAKGKSSISVEFPIAAGEQGRGKEIDCGPDQIVAFCQNLDYAVIRLPKPFGFQKYDQASNRTRGWFSLAGAQHYRVEGAKPVLVLHYPVVKEDNVPLRNPRPGKAMPTYTTGSLVRRDEERDHHLHHSAETRKGSSGGICLADSTHTPLGIHIKKTPEGTWVNAAIDMASIIQHIERNFAAASKELMNTPLSKLCPRASRDEMPILNRDLLIEKLVRMMSGVDNHPLYAFGTSQTGRTFIKVIVETLCSSRLQAHVEMSAFGKDHNVIRSLAMHFFGTTDGYPTFNPRETFAAYFRRMIGKLLCELNQHAEDGNTLGFVFFDGFDVADDDIATDLFSYICQTASQLRNVRVGLSGSIELPIGVSAARIDLGPIKPDDYRVLADSYCTYLDLDVGPTDRNDLVDALLEDIDFTKSSLAMYSTKAQVLCGFLRELAGV